MTIREVPNELNRAGRNIVNDNFKQFSTIESNAIKAILENNPSKLTPTLNGLSYLDFISDMRMLNNAGLQFTAKANGVISGCRIYAQNNSKMIVGLAEKEHRQIQTGIVKEQIVDLKKGWNHVSLLLPIEQGVGYLLYKKYGDKTITTGTINIRGGWSNHAFNQPAMQFTAGGQLDSTISYTNYMHFWDIEVITNLAQIFWLMNDSVVRNPEIYVGSNPPTGSKFWFRPVGS